MKEQQVALPLEVLEIIKQKPEATLMCLASFFQFGLHKEKGVVLKDQALWEFLLDQIIKMDAEIVKGNPNDEELN